MCGGIQAHKGANPLRARRFAQSMERDAKTDAVDAAAKARRASRQPARPRRAANRHPVPATRSPGLTLRRPKTER